MSTSHIERLDEALREYAAHLDKRPIADNTRKAFWGDVRLFERFLRPDDEAPPPLLAQIRSEHVRGFLEHEERQRRAASPKSLERRLTSLKVFFRFLRERGYIVLDPADGVPYKPLVDPLPELLDDEQAARALDAARTYSHEEKLDVRPFTVLTLVLETGIKKSECMALSVRDIVRDPRGIEIRYAKKHLKFKERTLPISAECLAVLDAHIARYEITDKLFPCTGRNLEYLLTGKVAPRAGLPTLTFEMLRWTCAMRDFRADRMNDEQLQHKYGLSPIGWTEMAAKLARADTKPGF
jgi:integrase/recombinase XerD